MMLAKWVFAAAALASGIGTVTSGTQAVYAAQEAGAQWQTDFEAAAAESKRTSKPMLVLFTGSDWCMACKRLKSEVLSKPEFDQAFGHRFVFVELDIPMRGAGKNAQKNKDLQKRFNVSQFPTLIVLDVDQKQVGQPLVGYGGGGVNGYVAQIDNLPAR